MGYWGDIEDLGHGQGQLPPYPEQIWAVFGITLQVLRSMTVSLDSVWPSPAVCGG